MLLYQKTYETAQKSMNDGGKSFSFSEKMFLFVIGKNPLEVSLAEFDGLNLDDYVYAFFYRCRNRLPDQRYLERINKLRKQHSDDVVKFFVIVNTYYSEEFIRKDAKITDIPDMRNYKDKIGDRLYDSLLWNAKADFFFKHYFLYPVWNTCPASIKNIIRNIRKN